MRIGVDLLWVRPGICGGTESVIRNLLDGFGEFDKENEYVLFVAKDNAETFAQYEKEPQMTFVRCNVKCSFQPVRILWENLFLDGKAGKENIDVMFIPVYSMPRTHGSGIPYVCTIHDLQAIHYPRYFSALKRLFLKQAWDYACRKAERIVTISDYCKNDLIEHYPEAENKVTTIYDAVASNQSDMPFSEIASQYGLEQGKYYYCVSSMLPHKNLETVLRVMELRKHRGENIPLVLSGVGGRNADFEEKVAALKIDDMVINTGFVSDAERDCLYENCRLFLFPSVFEGFGMPPIEAMRRGKQVVMTRESCLEEVTEGKAVYVDSPYDIEEWSRKIDAALQKTPDIQPFERYQLENVVREYVKAFCDMVDFNRKSGSYGAGKPT